MEHNIKSKTSFSWDHISFSDKGVRTQAKTCLKPIMIPRENVFDFFSVDVAVDA